MASPLDSAATSSPLLVRRPSPSRTGRHLISTAKYPRFFVPIPPSKVFLALAKAHDSFSQLSFQWTALAKPPPGECHLELKPEGLVGDTVPPQTLLTSIQDGYEWRGPVQRESLSAANQVLEICRICGATSEVGGEIVRLEYRLALPENRLVFVHYLSVSALTKPAMPMPQVRPAIAPVQIRPSAPRPAGKTSSSLSPSPSSLSLAGPATTPTPVRPAVAGSKQPAKRPAEVPSAKALDDIPDLMVDDLDNFLPIDISYQRLKFQRELLLRLFSSAETADVSPPSKELAELLGLQYEALQLEISLFKNTTFQYLQARSEGTKRLAHLYHQIDRCTSLEVFAGALFSMLFRS